MGLRLAEKYHTRTGIDFHFVSPAVVVVVIIITVLCNVDDE